MYRVGQSLAAVPLYGCCIAGEGCVRDYAHRRVSERNRRKAALSAEITQEGETGEAPPGADEASLFRGWPPNSGYAVSAVWLGPTVYSRSMRGRKDFFDPLRPRFSGAKNTEIGWADGRGEAGLEGAVRE